MDAIGYECYVYGVCSECNEYWEGDVMGWREPGAYGGAFTCEHCGQVNEVEFEIDWTEEAGWAAADAGRDD